MYTSTFFIFIAVMQTYHIYLYTGDTWGMGRDANAYLMLFGDSDDTGQVWLKTSKTNRNKFERNQIDKFVVEAVEIGELRKIKYIVTPRIFKHEVQSIEHPAFLFWCM